MTMRTTIFSENEICLHGDVNALQLDRMTDLAAVLASFDNKDVSEAPVGIEAVGVIAGLFPTAAVSGSNVIISITAGTLIYRYTTTSGSNYRVAHADAQTITLPLSPVGYHRSLFVEAVVSEEIVQADRTFRVDVNGHISEQTRPTDKYLQSKLTFRAREGITYGAAGNPFLPAFTTDPAVAVLGYMTVENASVTNVRQIRRRYRPGCGSVVFREPITATVATDKTLVNHYITSNQVGFGVRSPCDYADFEPAYGIALTYEAGVSIVANTTYYVYAVRPNPKVGDCDFIVTNKPPDENRNLSTGNSIALAGIWPQGVTVSGSEAKYLYAMTANSGGTLAASQHSGNQTKILFARPSVVVTNANAGASFLVDFSGVLPPTAMTVDFAVKFVFTAGATPAKVEVSVGLYNGSVLTPYQSNTIEFNDPVTSVAPYNDVLLEGLRTAFFSPATKTTNIFTYFNGDITTFDAYIYINGYTEVFAS